LDAKLRPAAVLLRAVAGAMAAGLALLTALVAYFNARAVDRLPTVDSLRTINLLTTFAMIFTLVAIFVSELVWRTRVRVATAESLVASVQGAFIARTAARESAALLGAVVALLAAQGGVLRLYPAYWANLVPAVLFASYLWAHWPSVVNLKAELKEVLPG
jgi:hypothetical protein